MLLCQRNDLLAPTQAVSGQKLRSYTGCLSASEDVEKVICERAENELKRRHERLCELTLMGLLSVIATTEDWIAQVAANVCRGEKE